MINSKGMARWRRRRERMRRIRRRKKMRMKRWQLVILRETLT